MTQYITSYWIGQEPTGPGKSPTLNQMPSYVDYVMLAFVAITDNTLDFNMLVEHNTKECIKAWIDELRQRGTKVLLSINSPAFITAPCDNLVAQIKSAVSDWGVDGIDIDFEGADLTPGWQEKMESFLVALRKSLGQKAVLTAPIFSMWLSTSYKNYLNQFSQHFDFITTMDYTPYPGLEATQSNVNQYADIIGGKDAYSKIGIGISCMDLAAGDGTPLADVKALSQWQPDGQQTQGMMLYTFSYDIEKRMVKNSQGKLVNQGTGYPDGTWINTIHESLAS